MFKERQSPGRAERWDESQSRLGVVESVGTELLIACGATRTSAVEGVDYWYALKDIKIDNDSGIGLLVLLV